MATVTISIGEEENTPNHYNDIGRSDIEIKAYYLLEACQSLVTILDLIKTVKDEENIGIELLIGHRHFGISNHPSTVHLLEQEFDEIIKFLEGKQNTWI